MAIDHNVFNEEFYQKILEKQKESLYNIGCDLSLLLIDNDIDNKIYTSSDILGYNKIDIIVLKKRFVPNFIQKRKVVKLLETKYRHLSENTRLKVFYSGEIIVDYAHATIPYHPNCKSYLTKI
jgi:hypothetical protein